jgi:hypothetical protein
MLIAPAVANHGEVHEVGQARRWLRGPGHGQGIHDNGFPWFEREMVDSNGEVVGFARIGKAIQFSLEWGNRHLRRPGWCW